MLRHEITHGFLIFTCRMSNFCHQNKGKINGSNFESSQNQMHMIWYAGTCHCLRRWLFAPSNHHSRTTDIAAQSFLFSSNHCDEISPVHSCHIVIWLTLDLSVYLRIISLWFSFSHFIVDSKSDSKWFCNWFYHWLMIPFGTVYKGTFQTERLMNI